MNKRKDREPYADVFRRLRLKITAISVSFVILVILIVFATIIASEYNAKIDFVSTQLSVAIRESSHEITEEEKSEKSDNGTSNFSGIGNDKVSDSLTTTQSNRLSQLNELLLEKGVFANEANVNLIDNRELLATVPEIGLNSSFDSDRYIPIIVYRIDYQALKLFPLDDATAKLTDESFSHVEDVVIDAPYGFSRDKTSSLCFQKSSTVNGDLVAFTDASSVDAYIQNVVQAFSSVFILVAFAIALVAWTASKWIVYPVAQTWQRQRRFVADASHELKTPLSVIIATTALFLDEEHSEETRKWARTTLDEAERMKGLISDMLDLAAADDGKELQREEVDIGREVSRWAMPFEAMAFEKGNELNYDDIDSDVMVSIDKQKMQRAVTILLDNACKYSSSNGRIDVSVHGTRRNAVISVSDIGEPIPEGKETEIFERFFRVDESRTGNEGYGLGLAMAKDIVEKHSGTISARSDGDLTIFTITLPRNMRKARDEDA